jgi:hypothetical protein
MAAGLTVNAAGTYIPDDDGFVVDKETWAPALPGPGMAGQAACNGFTQKTTTYKPTCSGCFWDIEFGSSLFCSCDMSRTKAPDVQTMSLQWKDTSTYVEVTAGVTGPAGAVQVNVGGKWYWKTESGYCQIVPAM